MAPSRIKSIQKQSSLSHPKTAPNHSALAVGLLRVFAPVYPSLLAFSTLYLRGFRVSSRPFGNSAFGGGWGGGVGVFLHTFEHVYHVRHVLPFARVTCRYPCLLLKVLAEY